MFKRILSTLLCCAMLICCIPAAVYAEDVPPALAGAAQVTNPAESEIAPAFTYTLAMGSGLSISSGLATCTTTLTGYSGQIRTVVIKMYLEKKTLWWWNEVTDWTQLFTDDYCYCSHQYTASGGTFRVRSVATVTGTDGGTETITSYSNEVNG